MSGMAGLECETRRVAGGRGRKVENSMYTESVEFCQSYLGGVIVSVLTLDLSFAGSNPTEATNFQER
jgi:hypothetical protein